MMDDAVVIASLVALVAFISAAVAAVFARAAHFLMKLKASYDDSVTSKDSRTTVLITFAASMAILMLIFGSTFSSELPGGYGYLAFAAVQTAIAAITTGLIARHQYHYRLAFDHRFTPERLKKVSWQAFWFVMSVFLIVQVPLAVYAFRR